MKKIGVILFFGIFISLFFDKQFAFFVINCRNFYLNWFFLNFSSVLSSMIILILMTLLFLKERRWLLGIWLSFGVSGFICYILKILVQRIRPFVAYGLELLNGFNYYFSDWNSSFPSWHASAPFVLIPFLFETKHKFRYVWLVIASLAAFDRIYVGVHYLSDVLFGALLGLSVGWMFLFLEKKFKFSGVLGKILEF